MPDMTLRITTELAAYYILAIAPEGRPFDIKAMLPGRGAYIERIEFILGCIATSGEHGVELERRNGSFLLRDRGQLNVHTHSYPDRDTPEWPEIRQLIDGYFGRLAERPKLN